MEGTPNVTRFPVSDSASGEAPRSEFHEAVRLVLQKDEREFIARAFGGVRELESAGAMTDAAIVQLEAAIESKVAAMIAATTTPASEVTP